MLKKNIKISGDKGYVMHQCILFGTALDFISNLAVLGVYDFDYNVSLWQ